MGNKVGTGRAVLIAAAVIAGGSALGACGSGSADDSTDTTTAVVDGLSLTSPWARTSAAGAMMGAAYLTITSPVDDALIGAKVDPSVAAMAEIHEVVPDDDAMSSDSTMAMDDHMSTDTTMAMEMKMQEVDRIEMPAGSAVELKPGGYHIMLMKLAGPLETGASIEITLVFENQGEKTVTFPVQEDAP
ncbi:MAG: copper chaperone PCu(A)C [Acidimicrobiales bacterium]